MDNAVRIQPDLQFVKDLQEVGGDSLKKCYQCATCSVACPISPAENPFPRKEMVWAQWGLKDRLVNDIDIWLCHNCGTCSDLCPRGAKPADLLAGLRNMAYQNLVEPSIIGKWMSNSKHLPKLIAIPAVLWAIIWMIRGAMLGSMFPTFVDDGHHGWKAVEEGGKVIYGGLFPGDYTIDPIFMITFFAMVYIFYKGVRKLIDSFDANLPKTFVVGEKQEKPCLIECIKDVIGGEIAQHTKWKSCGDESESDDMKFKGHIALMYAFVALAIVTGVVAVTHWGGKVIDFIAPIGHTPMHLLNPVKILANIGAVAFVFGLVQLTKRRLAQDPKVHGSSWYDWYLLGIVWTVGLSGIFCEILRLANVPVLAYPMYYVHLVSIWMLFAYLPWSKLGHLVYRTAALVYARYVGRVPLQTREEKIFIL